MYFLIATAMQNMNTKLKLLWQYIIYITCIFKYRRPIQANFCGERSLFIFNHLSSKLWVNCDSYGDGGVAFREKKIFILMSITSTACQNYAKSNIFNCNWLPLLTKLTKCNQSTSPIMLDEWKRDVFNSKYIVAEFGFKRSVC